MMAWLIGVAGLRRARFHGEWSAEGVCPYQDALRAAAWLRGRASRGTLDHLMEW